MSIVYPDPTLMPPDEARAIADETMAHYNLATSHWADMIARQLRIRALVEGRWGSVFPDDVTETELPKVANLFRVTIEDAGHLFGEITPTERCFPEHDTDQAVAASEKRERVMNAYTTGSREFEPTRQELRGMDMMGAAYTAIKVWPDFKQPPGKRFPRFTRLDPLNVLPETRFVADEPSDNVIVHWTETLARLAKEFPIQTQALLERIGTANVLQTHGTGYDIRTMAAQMNRPPEVRIIDRFSSSCIARIAVYSFEGRSVSELLAYRENETGICPVQLAMRPSWGGSPIGALDDVRGPVQSKNRAFTLLLDYFIDMVYGGKLVWNVKNPKDRGPNTVFYAMGPDAKMDPITPASPAFAAFNLISEMETEARAGAIAPSAREGDVNLNKATASFLTGAQGQLRSVVSSLHSNYASAKQYANTVAFEQDKAWCQASGKEVSGFSRGRRFYVKYDPQRDIGDQTANIVRHGAASGLDLPTHTVLMQNRFAQNTISLETLLEADPAIEDVAGEIDRIYAGKIADSVVAGFEQLPQMVRMQAYAAMREGKTLAEVSMIVSSALQAQQAQNPLAAVAAAGGGTPALPGGGPAQGITPDAIGAETPALPPRELLRASPGGTHYTARS